MNDTKPFKHGEEGTHWVCNKHNIGGKSVCCECSKKDDCGETNTIASIMNELKKRRNWNNPEEVEIWFERKLREVKAEAVAEERERVRKEIEFVKTNIAWCRTKGIDADSGDDARQIGWDGACDLILSSLDKPVTKKD